MATTASGAYAAASFYFDVTDVGPRNATQYKVGSSFTDDGVLASDHRPVLADITLE